MAGIYRTVELLTSTESAFAENAESAASNTWQKKIPCIGYTLTTSQERIRDGAHQGRMNDEALSHLGPREATLEFTSYWCGHLTTTAGSLTETWQQDLLSDGLGGGSTATVGTTVSAASSGSSVTFTSTSGLAAGAVVRVGAKGDARGDGQPAVVGTVASPVTLLTALPATPSNADVIYATQLAYHDESVANSLNSRRFLVGYASTPTAGQQYHLMGGQLAGVTLSIPVAQNALPTVTFTYRFAYWQRAAMTIPHTSLSLENQFAAPVVGGQTYLQTFGTTTHATVAPADLTLDVALGLEPIYGGTLRGTYQQVGGWARSGCKPTVTMQLPWATAYETLFDTANQSYTYRHILFNTNAIDGRSVGFYLPRAFLVGNRPSQPVEVNAQTYVPLTFVGTESTTTTTELTRSAVRIWSG